MKRQKGWIEEIAEDIPLMEEMMMKEKLISLFLDTFVLINHLKSSLSGWVVWQTVICVVFLLQSPLSYVRQSDYTSRWSVSLHGQGNTVNAESLCLLETHILLVVCVNISVNEATSWSSQHIISHDTSSTEVDTVNLTSLIRIPTSNNTSNFQTFLIHLLLQQSGCCFDMRKFALLIDMRINQKSQFMYSLLWLSSQSTSQRNNMFMHVIDLVSYSIDSVDPTGRSS